MFGYPSIPANRATELAEDGVSAREISSLASKCALAMQSRRPCLDVGVMLRAGKSRFGVLVAEGLNGIRSLSSSYHPRNPQGGLTDLFLRMHLVTRTFRDTVMTKDESAVIGNAASRNTTSPHN